MRHCIEKTEKVGMKKCKEYRKYTASRHLDFTFAAEVNSSSGIRDNEQHM